MMDIIGYIRSSQSLSSKYDYYIHLGYRKEVAAILSMYSYSSYQTRLVLHYCEVNNGDIFDEIYKKLESSKENTPDAIFYDSKSDSVRGIKGFVNKVKYSANPSMSRSFSGASPQGMQMNLDLAMPIESSVSEAMMFEESGVDGVLLENFATDEYENIEEKDSKNVFTSPTSTFRMTTNTASMGVVLNQIRNCRTVDMSQVRIEEILNYFDYSSNLGTHDEISVITDIMKKSDEKRLLYVNADIGGKRKDEQNIVLLLDVSGSMSGNAETTQEAIATIVSKLSKGDTFSLVTYSDKDETIFNGYKIMDDKDKEVIMARILKIDINGCTYGSAGIETAYKIARKKFKENGNNQVILITDGDLNFGIVKKDGLKALIEDKKRDNIFLSVIGTGLWNYKDDKLEVLAKNGNGVYVVVNSLSDVSECIDRRFESLTQIVAKDVKAQVEFNPKFVKSYRLLGYENRELNHEDFVNDTVISEPFGFGGHGVALYEIELQSDKPKSDLKYQEVNLKDSDELGELRIRYKEPLEDESKEVKYLIPFEEGDNFDIKLAYAIYVMSEKLRDSDKLDDEDEIYLRDFIKNGELDKYLEFNGNKLKEFFSIDI